MPIYRAFFSQAFPYLHVGLCLIALNRPSESTVETTALAYEDQLGSMEFATKLAGAKLVFVVGHSACGAVKGACDCFS
jgi:hypothetical protein